MVLGVKPRMLSVISKLHLTELHPALTQALSINLSLDYQHHLEELRLFLEFHCCRHSLLSCKREIYQTLSTALGSTNPKSQWLVTGICRSVFISSAAHLGFELREQLQSEVFSCRNFQDQVQLFEQKATTNTQRHTHTTTAQVE